MSLVGTKVQHALAQFDQGDRAGAIVLLRRLVAKDQRDPQVCMALASCLKRDGQFEAALHAARLAVAAAPRLADAHRFLGGLLLEGNRGPDAAASFRKAVDLAPEQAVYWHGLARSLALTEPLDTVLEASRRSLELARRSLDQAVPGFATLHEDADALTKGPSSDSAQRRRPHVDLLVSLLGWHADVLFDAARATEGVACLRAALELKPADPTLEMTFAQRLLYDELASEDEVAAAHTHAASLVARSPYPLPILPPASAPPARAPHAAPIRVGYCSGDLCCHSVAFFFEPLVRAHDRARVRVHVYDSTPPSRRDAVSERIARASDAWFDASSVSDEALARQIRADGIDVLIDLSGLTPGQRLRVFAARPAAVQLSYLGYPLSLAHAQLDARLSDHLADPERTAGDHDRAAEQSRILRLPRCFLCYAPPAGVSEKLAPAAHSGDAPIVFASFNNVNKLGEATIRAWARVLARMPGSHLHLKSFKSVPSLIEVDLRKRFEACGVDGNRVRVLPNTPDVQSHLAAYQPVCVALDTFPYHGTTTTCEALFMGVPVVTLVGAFHRARVGASLLAAVGLDDLVCRSWDEYVDKAVELARDHPRRQTLARDLRPALLKSPLCDAPELARTLEAAFAASLAS
ncbi:MAG: tetratricopeptide repeat protein [Planctomycetota bacterium]|nr:tetratricopeptide repeat protein [Planctomycetota bacterium]